MDNSQDIPEKKDVKEEDLNEDNIIDEKDEKDEKEDKEDKEVNFSKNSIINISRKAGVKCISQCGIDKVRNILNDKIKDLSDKLSVFYSPKNGRTITKKTVAKFLESEGINITSKE